jgi:hypothetical protein
VFPSPASGLGYKATNTTVPPKLGTARGESDDLGASVDFGVQHGWKSCSNKVLFFNYSPGKSNFRTCEWTEQKGIHQPHGGTAPNTPSRALGFFWSRHPPVPVAESVTNPKQLTPTALSQASTETPLPGPLLR